MRSQNQQKILLTGATGYIGRRLMRILQDDPKVQLRLLVRQKGSLFLDEDKRIEKIHGSSFDAVALARALEGIDVAYYLIHSLGDTDFEQKDRDSARLFRDAAIKAGVKKIIYLGGLGLKNNQTSAHLSSRIETGEILSARPEAIDVIWLRAGVIIGSGSASFEIIRHLIEKLPIMITPKWVRTMAQPIGVDDVLSYLDASRDPAVKGSHIVDIGSEQLCYETMMTQCAEVMGLKRYIVPVPFLSVGLSSYWLNIFTPVPFSVARALIAGLRSEVIVQNDHAKTLFPDIHPSSFALSVTKALQEAEHNQILSRWSDKGGDVWETDHQYSIANAVYLDRQIEPLGGIPASKVFERFSAIGGENGWFGYDWLWEIRGFLDKIVGGAGINRGRRSADSLRVGDSVDFWKVIAIEKDERLLLFAQMKVPGKAYLEFKIDNDTLIQSAYFLPKGIWGRLYWWMLIPVHDLVFVNMIQTILKEAKQS
jgi:uncharacterized protein YbjT (DUF2867 family)